MGFKELAIVSGTLDTSYRKTTECLNRIRHQPNATPLRTLQDAVEAEGLALAKALDKEARSVLQEAGIDAETLQPIQHATLRPARLGLSSHPRLMPYSVSSHLIQKPLRP